MRMLFKPVFKELQSTSKALGLMEMTRRAIISNWREHGIVVNVPSSGQPTKITPRVQQ